MIDQGDRESASEPQELVRSEERLLVTTRRVPVAKAVLRKRIVVEQHTITVDVAHEEVELEQRPIESADSEDGEQQRGAHIALPDLVLHKEELVITRRVVPVERIHTEIVTVSGVQRITERVGREQVDVQHASADD